MAYKNRIIYILLLLIVGSSSYRLSATSHSDSTRHHVPKSPSSVSAPTTVLTQRQFASLEAFVQAQAQTISTQPIHITAPAEFTEAYIRDNFTVSAAVADARDSAKAAFGQIEKSNNYVESFAMDNLLELPVGLKKRVGNSDVVIGIVKARFYQGYAEMTVFCKIDLPQKVGSDGARTIFFGADNVRFTRRGAIQGTPKLVLLGDVPIPFNGGNSLLTLRGGFNMRTGQLDSLTYVKFNCNGIEEVSLTAEIAFSRNLVIPLHPTTLDTLTDTRIRVKGSFQTVVRDWNDIVATIALPPFAIKKMESVAFKVESATFDFSDIVTPSSVAFPQSYTNLLPPNRSLWRGVYISSAKVYLPEEFKLKGSTGRVEIEARALLIDNLGLTGHVSVNNIYQSGSASKWDMSLDKFELEVVTNSLRSAGFHGAIALPVTAKKDTTVSKYGMRYSAVFTSSRNYVLTVSVKDTLDFDLWKAKAQLYEGTYVSLIAKNKNFSPKAVLNGKIAVTGFSKNDSTELAGLVFQGFMMQSGRDNEPRCSLASAGYVVDSSISNKLSKFPLSINTLTVAVANDDVSLRVGFGITLGDTNRFAASSVFNIIGTFKDSANRVSYAFKELKVESIGLTGDFNAFILRGSVNVYQNDPQMGKGFGGNVAMTMKIGKDTINMSVALAFGRVNSYRYWYVDAAVSGFRWDVAPGLAITGLGGGAWNKMIKTEKSHPDLSMMPTGSTYTPKADAGFGFRAMTQFVVGGKSVAQGNLSLEVLFNSAGGVNRILLYGGAVIMPSLDLRKFAGDNVLVKNKLLSKLKGLNSKVAATGVGTYLTRLNTVPAKQTAEETTEEPEQAEKSTIAIKLGIEYDFRTKTLDGNFGLNVNLANGIITGGGNARMYFAPDKWYIHIGKPSSRMNFRFNIPGVRANSGSYFMAGTELEASPDIPAQVQSILGPANVQNLNMMRNMSALGSGKGMAMGATLDAAMNYDFSFIYARFSGGVGFDIMVKDYGDMRCRGYLDPVGIRGWYASGQAYAYVQGNLGVRVRLRFFSKDISIISGNAALLLQSKLPKPSWFSGYLTGSFSVLRGAVQGNFNCDMTFGDNCELLNNNTVTSEQNFIKEVLPLADTPLDSVEVFAQPSVTLKVANRGEMQVEDPATGQIETYRPILTSLTAINESANNANITGNIVWNTGATTATLEVPSTLPPASNIRVTAVVAFEKMVSPDVWESVMVDRQAVTETKSITFTTGSIDTEIPNKNIAWMYPANNQKNYLRSETNKGMIKLKRAQSNLLKSGTPIQVIFSEEGTNRRLLATNCSYSETDLVIRYTIPVLSSGKGYSAAVYVEAPGRRDTSLVHSFIFRSSVFESLNQRMIAGADSDIGGDGSSAINSILTNSTGTNTGNAIILTVNRNVANMDNSIGSNTISSSTFNQLVAATFDKSEVMGTQYTGDKPLITKEAILDDPYYAQQIDPYLYKSLNDYEPDLIKKVIEERQQLGLGTPPKKAVEVPSGDKESLDNSGSTRLGSFPYEYTVPYYYEEDLQLYKEELLDKYLYSGTVETEMTLPEHIVPVIDYTCPPIPRGEYAVKYKYELPDGTKTSEKTVIYKYED